MRYLTFSLPADPVHRIGALTGDRITEIPEFPSLLALIHAGPEAWQRTAAFARAAGSGGTFAAGDVRWHAPIPRPTKNVFCLGRNYTDHLKQAAQQRAHEFHLPLPPVFFPKP